MATPRRRSSRIQGSMTPIMPNATPLSKLSSLLERDESPSGIQSSLDAIVATPMAPPNTVVPKGRFGIPSPAIKTPHTAPRAAYGEFYKNQNYQSPTKSIASISSYPVNDVPQTTPSTPTVPTITRTIQDTPSRVRASLPTHMNSPTFDFSFERPESDLSVEAQKIMESVREEAAKIKKQMLEERAKQDRDDGETDQLYGAHGRRIAKPKAKTGRFSDVHKQEFKKMDSIVSHASTWKNKMQGDTAQSLKRSPSKAGLDETITPKSISKSKSMRSLHFNTRDTYEISSPGKRPRRDYAHDTSSVRPVSQDSNESIQNTPAKTRPTSQLPSAAVTPTKASLARSASVKNIKTSMIPSLSRTASTMTLGATSVAMPKTEGSNKYAASLLRFSGSMKSILQRAQPKAAGNSRQVAFEPHLALPKANFGTQKDLPSLPNSPSKDLPPMQPSPLVKRVNCSESTEFGYPRLPSSPSMSKIPTPRALKVAQQSLSSPPKANLEAPVSYPLLASSPNITTRRPIPRPTIPGDFTFRADKEIEFSPSKVNSPASTTIRVVRPSGFPTPMPGAFDVKTAISHGMSNKKRKHDADDDSEVTSDVKMMDTAESKENMPTKDEQDEQEEHPAKKKKRTHVASPSSLQAKALAQSPLKRRFGTATKKTPKKGAMSLARLSALARPKERR